LSPVIQRSIPSASTLLAKMSEIGLLEKVKPKIKKQGLGFDVILTDFPLRWREEFEKKKGQE